MWHVLSIGDLSKTDMEKLFALSDTLKEKVSPPNGKLAALLFNLPSTRTLLSFQAALAQLGIASSHVEYVFTQMVRGEEIQDTARALGQYACTIVARLSDHRMLETLAAHSPVPVINAATPLEHPCQALADLYTLRSQHLLRKGARLVFVGDPTSNIAHSLLLGASLFELDVRVVAPSGYAYSSTYSKKLSSIPLGHSMDALAGADIVYTHSWIQQTPSREPPERLKEFLPYQLNADTLAACKNARIMHPLPAFRGMEITGEILDSPRSLALEQSKNRLYVQKALLKMLLSL